LGRPTRIFGDKQLIATDAREVVHVTRPGHAHGRMNQKAGFDLARSAKCQFYVCAMHRIPCLEADDPAPAETNELRAQIRRCKPKSPEILMRRHLKAFYAPPHVPAMSLVQKIIDTRMQFTGGSKNSLRFGFAIGLPYILHV